MVKIIASTLYLVALTNLTLVEGDGKQDNLFKFDKLNLIYNKAKNTLGDYKLKNLRIDFLSLQQDQATLKRIKADGLDKDGLHEAAVRRKFLTVLEKYGLDQYYHDVHPPIDTNDGTHMRKIENLAMVTDTNPETIDHINHKIFRDSRLDKLWKKAEKYGFSKDELKVLKEEFRHQQDKLDEHNEMLNFVDSQTDEIQAEQERWENHIENTMQDNENTFRSGGSNVESPSDKKNRLDQNAHQALKDKHKEIKKGFSYLEKKVVTGKDSNPDNFDEPKVNELWSSAQKANFTEEELLELREELHHYQTRIRKLKHYEVQLELEQVNSEPSKDDDHEVRSLKKRLKELNFKIDKIHKTIENKIIGKRVEL